MSQRIMAIDDSDIAQEFIRSNLAELGYDNVVSFMDPCVALKAIESGEAEADLILMDIMMPEIDGIELCARIKMIEAWRDTPVIMLTSRKDMESLSAAFMAGANDYVTKPFDRIELQARMRSSLRLKSELDRRRATEVRNRSRAAREQKNSANSGTRPAMLGGQAGMRADLLALSPDAQSELGLIVFKIDNLGEKHALGDDQQAQIIHAVARALSQVQITAGERFAHWDEGVFCLVGKGVSEDELRTRAQAFLHAVDMAEVLMPDTWRKTPVTMSAAIAPAREGSIGARLARAVETVERSCDAGTIKAIITATP